MCHLPFGTRCAPSFFVGILRRTTMQSWEVVAISVAIVVIAAIGWLFYERSRSRRLRDHFGSEYDRTMSDIGDRRRAEAELTRRETRIRKLDVRPLSASDRV